MAKKQKKFVVCLRMSADDMVKGYRGESIETFLRKHMTKCRK
jgi:hypothetical protein